MKLNKDFLKRTSTWVNAASVALSGVMIYIPDLPIHEGTKSWIMFGCGLAVALSQFFTFGVNQNAKPD